MNIDTKTVQTTTTTVTMEMTPEEAFAVWNVLQYLDNPRAGWHLCHDTGSSAYKRQISEHGEKIISPIVKGLFDAINKINSIDGPDIIVDRPH